MKVVVDTIVVADTTTNIVMNGIYYSHFPLLCNHSKLNSLDDMKEVTHLLMNQGDITHQGIMIMWMVPMSMSKPPPFFHKQVFIYLKKIQFQWIWTRTHRKIPWTSWTLCTIQRKKISSLISPTRSCQIKLVTFSTKKSNFKRLKNKTKPRNQMFFYYM